MRSAVARRPTARRALGHVAATGAGIALLLSGCTGSDPQPTVTSTTAKASTSSSSPAPSAPSPSRTQPLDIPEAATKHTDAGAAAFAGFFIAHVSRAELTGDTSGILPLSTRACAFCREVKRFTDAHTASGERLDTEPFEIRRMKVQYRDDDRAVVDADVRDRATNFVNSRGVTIKKKPAAMLRMRIELTARQAGGWLVNGVSGR